VVLEGWEDLEDWEGLEAWEDLVEWEDLEEYYHQNFLVQEVYWVKLLVIQAFHL